jgi:nicotinamidase/pyrazinamidase
MTTTTTTTLLLIDAQKDFHPGGSLAIPTANEDAARIATLLTTHPTHITRVVATMDSHLKLHIAHPGFWLSCQTGEHPDVFTIISHQDVVDGKWKPRSDIDVDVDMTTNTNTDSSSSSSSLLDPSVFEGASDMILDNGKLDLQKYALEYTKRLEAKSKFRLCIWPEHCLIGSPGHALVDDIRGALDDWSETTGRRIEFVCKGENILTESYSAMEAEVPVTRDTQFNQSLFESLLGISSSSDNNNNNNNRLLVCGQAMSHCVNSTLRNLTERWPKERIGEITLLTDCASSVPGFEAAGEEFQKDMKDLGVVLQTADQVFATTTSTTTTSS